MDFSIIDNVNKLLAEYDFRMNENIPEKVKCSKCGKILINACQGPCGCRYCRVCVDGLVESGCRVCPGNTDFCTNANLSHFNENYQIQKKISQIVVTCPQERCALKSELINLNEHLRICPMRSVKCVFYDLGCDKSKLIAAKVNEHLQLANYSHMEMLMGVIDDMNNKIERLNENYERNKKEIDQLKENDERNKNEIDRVKEINERYKNEINRLESDKRKKNEIDRLKENDEKNKKEIDRLKENDARNFNEIDILNRDSMIKSERIQLFEEEIKSMKVEKIDNLKREILKIIESVDAGMIEMQQEWRQTNEKYMMGMETRISVTEKWMDKLIDGTFIWYIDNVTQRIENKEIVKSEYFYGKMQPYKMALSMRVKGDTPADGAVLSIFVWIYSDVRDQSLKWSLPADVSVRIVNKSNPNAYRIIKKNYTVKNRKDKSIYILNNCGDFDFPYDDLYTASLLIDDSFIVECRVDVYDSLIDTIDNSLLEKSFFANNLN